MGQTLPKELLSDALSFAKVHSPLQWAFTNNDSALAQWQAKRRAFEFGQEQRIKSIQQSLARVDLTKATVTRLQIQLDGEVKYLRQIQKLLDDAGVMAFETSLSHALADRIPSQQHFDSYTKNIFRDWVWGEDENQKYAALIKGLTVKPEQILIVGGGSGRLAQDAANIFSEAKNIVSFDINPLLSLIGQKLTTGQTCQLMEFANHAHTHDNICQLQTLKNTAAGDDPRLHFVLGDISNHPFAESAFDLVICPWVIDVVPEPFESLSRRLNGLLKKTGTLIIFGPLSFEKARRHDRHGQEEVKELLEAAGFADIELKQVEVPYLQSPLDTQHRSENIMVAIAHKSANAKKPAPFHSLPDWLRDINLKSTLEAQNVANLFNQLSFESQLLAALTGGQSVGELAKQVSASAHVDVSTAETILLGTLVKMIESGLIET